LFLLSAFSYRLTANSQDSKDSGFYIEMESAVCKNYPASWFFTYSLSGDIFRACS